MTEIEGKGAFITGGASGIGFALAQALMSRGARVVIADVDRDALAAAGETLGAGVATVHCDVADLHSVQKAAAATVEALGNVHLVFNNAGVGAGGPAGAIPVDDWRWIVDINLMGVVHGVETFLPILRRQGQGGRLINTASMAGQLAAPLMGPYNATKFAVVGYSESLEVELKGEGIGVSVLCPEFVRTNIYKSGRNRPSAQPGEQDEEEAFVKSFIDSGISAETVAALTVESIEADRFYIFTHPEMKAEVDARMRRLLADYDACSQSAALTAT